MIMTHGFGLNPWKNFFHEWKGYLWIQSIKRFIFPWIYIKNLKSNWETYTVFVIYNLNVFFCTISITQKAKITTVNFSFLDNTTEYSKLLL